MFKNLVPKIFYDRLQDGLRFFVDALGFSITYRDDIMAVVERDGAKACIVQSPEFAAKDRPELGIDVDHADEVFGEMSARAPQLLHPNANVVSLKTWGAREFAMRDETGVCVIFREWQHESSAT